ncbi:MAG TPA: ABC transporter ATP-binding protein [bacterium]|nr:ABC transporter ATP-binding protein [bacterium]
MTVARQRGQTPVAASVGDTPSGGSTVLAHPKILIEDVMFEYPDPRSDARLRALDGVTIRVRKNEFFCVLGPSGCGKSTLLYLIAGLQRPTQGRILVDGTPVKGPGADRGLVFQEYALLPWRTVRENVGLGLKIRGAPQAERDAIARAFIELIGLRGFEDKFPHELSGGMRQRVAVARTLANSPQVALMDEPFAAVDAQTRTTLQEELTRIWSQTKVTVFFVTHNVDEAIFLGDRVLVMTPRPGRVQGIVTVNVPREERQWATLERDPRFVGLRSQLNEMIRQSAVPADGHRDH